MTMIATAPRTTHEQRDALLRRLYAEQDLPVGLLAGTRQLRELTAAYYAGTGIPVDEGLILRRLSAMGRAGEIQAERPTAETESKLMALASETKAAPAATLPDQILKTLREHGPMNEDLLVILADDEGVRAAAEAMAQRNELTLVQYLKPDGTVSALYLHPACRFRVANFR